MNVKLGNKINISLYLFKVYKSKYLEENKDRVMTQDEINDNMDKCKLLYLFSSNTEDGNEKEEYMKFVKKFGTKVNVSGYGYNLDKIAEIISAVDENKIYGGDLVITNNKANENIKTLTLYHLKNGRSYKININEKNKEVIVTRDFIAYGVNMLCMDEVENISIDEEYLISKIDDCMNKNGGYITNRNTLCLFKDYVGKNFIRKWNEENMFVSIVINGGFDLSNYLDMDEDWEYYDDEDGDW